MNAYRIALRAKAGARKVSVTRLPDAVQGQAAFAGAETEPGARPPTPPSSERWSSRLPPRFARQDRIGREILGLGYLPQFFVQLSEASKVLGSLQCGGSKSESPAPVSFSWSSRR